MNWQKKYEDLDKPKFFVSGPDISGATITIDDIRQAVRRIEPEERTITGTFQMHPWQYEQLRQLFRFQDETHNL